jgi:hypothetical protein
MRRLAAVAFVGLCACTGDDVIYDVDASESGPSEAGFYDASSDSGIESGLTDSGSDASDSVADSPILDAAADGDSGVAVSCNNNIKDGTETDIDCGGMSCPSCAKGKMCLKNPDCQSNSCKNNVCQ